MKKILLYAYYIFAVMVFNSCLAAHPPRARALARTPATQNPPRARRLVECLKYDKATYRPAERRGMQIKTALPMPPEKLDQFREIYLKYMRVGWDSHHVAAAIKVLQAAGFSDTTLGDLKQWIESPLLIAVRTKDIASFKKIRYWQGQGDEETVRGARMEAIRVNDDVVFDALRGMDQLAPFSDSEFCYAIKCKRERVLTFLLKKERRVDEQQQVERLRVAIESGCCSVVELLLQNGYDCTKFACLLASAVSQKNKEIFDLLLKSGAPIDPLPGANERDAREVPCYTALSEAIRHNAFNIAMILLERGADPNRAGANKLAPLHVAAYEHRVAIIEPLLKKGANPYQTGRMGETPLHVAAYEDQVEIIEILLRYNAEIDDTATSASKETPLHVATCKHNFNVVKLLLERGANPNRANANGEIPLHVATYEHHVDVVKILLERGANPNRANANGETPLHVATYEHHIHVVKILLANGANPNVPLGVTVDRRPPNDPLFPRNDEEDLLYDPNFYQAGGCPLHIAAKAGNESIVRLLLTARANREFRDPRGRTARDIATIIVEDMRGVKRSGLEMFKAGQRRKKQVPDALQKYDEIIAMLDDQICWWIC